MTHTVVVLSDMQIPYHDRPAIRAAIDFIKHTKPAFVVNVGDELDAPQPSRWNKGAAGEFEPDLAKHIELNREIQAEVFDAANGRYHIMRSNHVDRIETYIRRYAPAFSHLQALKIEKLLGYDEIGLTYHRKPWEFAPGWILCHGDEGSQIRTSAGTALNLAKRFGKSVVCGHTHKAGLQHDHDYFDGRVTRSIYGMEVGNMMDMRKAQYLKTGGANWQQAIGELVVENRTVSPKLHLIHGGRILT